MTLKWAHFLFAADMLKLAADEFGNHTCSDLAIENSHDGLEFIKGMIAASDYPDEQPNISKDGKDIYVMDWQVMDYLAGVFGEEADRIADAEEGVTP